jgi:hypothetical protein
LPDDPKPVPRVKKVQESQQWRSLQPSTVKALFGVTSTENPFAAHINVVADTPQAAPPVEAPPIAPTTPASDSSPPPPAPSTTPSEG